MKLKLLIVNFNSLQLMYLWALEEKIWCNNLTLILFQHATPNNQVNQLFIFPNINKQ